jgi:hypothetical protein
VTREEFAARVDWPQVRADVAEAKAGLETRISQRRAEVRSACAPVTLADQERFAAWQDNIDACDELLASIDVVTG